MSAYRYFSKGYNFYTYFYGHKFTRVTKQQPLVSIFHPMKGIPEMTAAIQCYALYLAGLTFYTEYGNTFYKLIKTLLAASKVIIHLMSL